MFRFVFYFYLVFFINPIFGATYFVTPNGSAQNNGQSEGNAWSFEHAVSMANAGDLINVKAGVYADLTLTFTKSGTANNLIHFRGYKSTPGDIQSHYSPTFQYGDSIASNPMPVLRENRASNNEGQGMGMNVRGSYIRLENLLVQYYSHGVHIDSSQTGCHLKNIVCVDQGDYNVAHSYNPPSMPDAFQNYDGNGITARGTNHVFENIFVLNSGAQGFTLYDRGHTVNNSRVMCDNTVNPTDYYFLVSGVESTSTNIYVKRVGPLSHAGHGIVLKGNHVIERNLVDGFEIVNTNLEVQFPKTAFNVLRNGVVYKEANVNENNVDYAGINLANGAHHNVYQDIYVKNSMIRFTDWPDGLAGDVADSSDHNLFNRIIVDGGFAAIAFNYFHAGDFTTSADNNTFYNFVANDCNYLYENSRANSNTRLINFALRNVGGLEAKRGGSPGYTVDAQYSNGNFDNCGFSVQGQKLTTKSSLFEDPNNGKFALQENSELRGKGDATPFMAAGNDLGAIQSSITTTVQTTPTTTPATTPTPTATTPQVTQTLPSTTCLETSLATDLLVQRDDIDLSANQLRFSLRVSDIGDNDAVLCLAAVTSVAWSNCSVSVRARGGQFDALNADAYATLASAACTPNVDHMVTFSIDHEAQQYDVDVDGVTIAENFAFRASAQKGPLRSMQLLSQRDYVNAACFLGSSSQQSTASTTAASTAQATTTGVETTPVIDPSATPTTTKAGAATTPATEPTTTTSVTSTGTTASTPAVTLYEPNANCVDGALLCLCRGGECDDDNAYCESNVPFAAGLCLQEVDTSCNGQVGCACVASDDGLKCLQGAVCASAANKSFCVREAQAETISMGSIVSANLLLIVVFQLFR